MQAHDETRIRFEAAVVERLKESGFLEIQIRTECLARVDDGYQDEVINAGWHYWQTAIGAKHEDPRVYVVGDKTMEQVFKPSGLTNISDMQAVLDAIEVALSGTMAEGVDISRLPVGTPVKKVLGYPFPGTVVAVFHTLSGQERFVVEATGEAYAGMLHIFNGDQLRASTEGSVDA